MIKHQWITERRTWDMWPEASSGVFITGDGVSGMDDPEFEDQVTVSDDLDGQEYQDYSAKPRAGWWAIALEAAPGMTWQETQSAFWRDLQPGNLGRWRVLAPDGTWRELLCRRESRASQKWDRDPSEVSLTSHVVPLIADDPWWRGPTIGGSFQPDPELPFFPTDGGASGAVLHLMNSFSVERAWIRNPGDKPAWPLWTINGPVTGFTVGVGSAVITGQITIPSGRYIRIDTDPTASTFEWNDGSQIPWSQFLGVNFAPVPPGERVILSALIDGAGSVDVEIVPRYLRAI